MLLARIAVLQKRLCFLMFFGMQTWDSISPVFDSVLAGNHTILENCLFFLERHGHLEVTRKVADCRTLRISHCRCHCCRRLTSPLPGAQFPQLREAAIIKESSSRAGKQRRTSSSCDGSKLFAFWANRCLPRQKMLASRRRGV